MATSLNEVTALPQRTVTAGAWSKASHTNPVSPGEVNASVNGIMAELDQPEISPTVRTVNYTPWIRPIEACSGVMWASVPNVVESWRDAEGGWIIAQKRSRPALSPYYLRLSPAPAGEDWVQHGFCPIRLNRLDEIRRERWGHDELRMVRMNIQVSKGCSLRVDKMIISAIRLAQPTVPSAESDRFRELLGRRSISVFVEDMLRGCYADSSNDQNVLRGRDERYVEMMRLVVGRAYGVWDVPRSLESLDRFRNLMGVSTNSNWDQSLVWPYLFNVVMPRDIFEANSRNLEAGIPPIVPHYVTPKTHMFNGPWNAPCSGLNFPGECGVSLTGRKIVAGVMGRSNTDLPGEVSLWPTRDNPPQEWVDGFLGCVERIAELEMPLDIVDRVDLVLHESHRIPLVFRVHTPGSSVAARTHKFMRMTEGRFDPYTRSVQNITVRECSPSGNEWVGEGVRSSTVNPSEATASPPPGGSGTVDGECIVCGEATDTTCPGCNSYFCMACGGCDYCNRCDDCPCDCGEDDSAEARAS